MTFPQTFALGHVPSSRAVRPSRPTVGAVAVGAKSLAKHGSTFHFAHRLFGRKVAEDVQVLYGFCRFVDDLVDEQPADRARNDLERVRSDLVRGSSDQVEVAGYIELSQAHSVDPAVTLELLAGFEDDLSPSAFRTHEQLLRYCYRVAGTVGLLMCSILDVDRERAQPFAIDLGVSMQLTNICRDVREDALRGRVYLPASATGGALSPASLAEREPGADRRARAGVEDLLDLARQYYRSAEHGSVYLPFRACAAVLVASKCYEAIGPRVSAAAADTIPGRVFVGKGAKVFHGARAMGQLALQIWPRLVRRPGPIHRPELHASLVGLPGVDPRCSSARQPEPCST